MIMLPLYVLCLALELVHVLARFLVAYGIARAFRVAEDPAAWIGVVRRYRIAGHQQARRFVVADVWAKEL